MIQEIIEKIEKEIELRKNMPHDYEQIDICYGLNRAKELVSSVKDTGWIPVTERMPEEGEEVLVTDRYGERRIAYHSREGWHLALTGSIYVHNPKAWIPLPEPFDQVN